MATACYLQRHPRTGVFWFRRAVPKSLRPYLGRREITRSLRTRDPSEARLRAFTQAAEVERLFVAAEGRAVAELPCEVIRLGPGLTPTSSPRTSPCCD